MLIDLKSIIVVIFVFAVVVILIAYTQ